MNFFTEFSSYSPASLPHSVSVPAAFHSGEEALLLGGYLPEEEAQQLASSPAVTLRDASGREVFRVAVDAGSATVAVRSYLTVGQKAPLFPFLF